MEDEFAEQVGAVINADAEAEFVQCQQQKISRPKNIYQLYGWSLLDRVYSSQSIVYQVPAVDFTNVKEIAIDPGLNNLIAVYRPEDIGQRSKAEDLPLDSAETLVLSRQQFIDAFGGDGFHQRFLELSRCARQFAKHFYTVAGDEFKRALINYIGSFDDCSFTVRCRYCI
ncbi:hypothetical protein MIR68_009122 [Amoeboaphelidium protococcarum]|nr:hypothetical protein MIR68_009122 [Amoeboaphelidium protococcarum]